MRELTEVRRPGPMGPLELQLRRVETRAAFLVLELEKLDELVGAGARMSDAQANTLAQPFERLGDLVVGLVRRHDSA